MKLVLFSTLLLACFSIPISGDDASPCNGWEQYKDEHCYQLFQGLGSYSEAENTCSTHNSSMVSIHYAEEQNFLNNFLFTKKKVVDNVWIGAKYVGNKQFQWVDHTPLAGKGLYQNWAAGSPKNLSDYCVQMQADVGSLGKWVDEPCARKNLVLCQRTPTLSLNLIAETIFVLKHSLLQITEQLTTNKLEAEREIAQLKRDSVPIGFTYVQLPKDKAPQQLWPNMTWKDVSADYGGVFFRVVGGNAADFGETQLYNAPRLETVFVGDRSGLPGKSSVNYDHNLTIPVTGWSDGIVSGDTYNSNGHFYMNFKHSDESEVRPVNMAIKVYRRTA